MSVLSRRHTVPAQRGAHRVLDLDAPAPATAGPQPADADVSRTGLLIAGATVAIAAVVGTAVYLDDGSTPASSPTTSTTVDSSLLQSEAQRDAAAARRSATR